MDIVSSVLEVEALTIAYGKGRRAIEAVSEVSLSIESGEALGLVGESGCGKSTLAMSVMSHLTGGARILSGSVQVCGIPVNGLRSSALRDLRARKLAMIHQDPMASLNPRLRIGRQLREVATLAVLSREEREARIEHTLRSVRLADTHRVLSSYPFELSGGQKQRIVIAMALLARPALMLLDEPTTALDVSVQAEIVDLIAEIRSSSQMGMLFISHDLPLVAQVCSRIGVMYKGELVEIGPTDQIMNEPSHPYSRALLACTPRIAARGQRALLTGIDIPSKVREPRIEGCRFADRCSNARADSCLEEHPQLRALNNLQPDDRVRCHFPITEQADVPLQDAVRNDTAPAALPAPLLEADHLTRLFPHRAVSGNGQAVRANDDISFHMYRGRTLAVIGESGSGKSTLARLVIGLDQPSDGYIRFEGSKLPPSGRSDKVASAMQMVFQNPGGTLNPARTVGTGLRRAIRKLTNLKAASAVDQRARDLMLAVQLDPALMDRYPAELSGGQKQRVAIARAFAGSPALVIADEAVSALDVSVQASILQLLKHLQAQRGTAILFISHDLAVVHAFADDVMIVYRGKVVHSGLVDDVYHGPLHPYTERLLNAALRSERPILETTSDENTPVTAGHGCVYAQKCHRRLGDICLTVEPPERRAAEATLRCHILLEQLGRLSPRQRVMPQACNPGGTSQLAAQ
ncbi:ABC transporter ATP-binding protein [Mesorhizobium sp. CA8]|uniref:dipeptide ABC transporter ATP-binding protein n=1 Tax=unclassified Mesorhizobium TaxID=325217 RepID=UPI001CCFB1D9|nr:MULTISPECIES: ABC transporter ATP-binding protein [unclassified Mesorhizobium]MBZ9761707.1 ABC transporter ATP-binding protein [Mesorhizobium sp. CA8]MBZ9820539.1 ABC transporter ATP-binding protein [Mesorhizobium sp. CA4]